MKRFLTLVAAFPMFAAIILSGQNTGTGLPAFGSLTSFGFDTVNNQNLNVYAAIPIASSPGRGMPLVASLVNNSLIWQKGTNWTPVVDSSGNPTWGWLTGVPLGGTVKYTSNTSSLKCAPGTQFYPVTFYSNYSYTDALGTVHYAPTISFRRSACPSENFGTDAAYANDTTGIYISDVTGGSPSVTSPRGDSVGTSSAVDTNGNYITKTVVSSTENDYTDSVNNKALKVVYSPNSTNPTQIQYEFLDGTGASNYQTITLKLTSLSISTKFSCSGVGEYSGTANLPTEMDIPTPGGATLKYLFTYEYTPGSQTTYTGRLQRVTVPTGGYYEYDYTGANDGINCSDGTALGLNRVISDGTSTATWNFVRSTANSTTTITTPQLADTAKANDTVFTFNSTGRETARKIYAESPGATLLRTINTTWASNGTPATQVTILEDNSTQTEVDTGFDSNGLLDSMSEYDWGTGSRGNLLRTTTLTYLTSTNYTNRNIINLLTSKVVKDGSGTIQYRQDTTYDGVALASCTTGVPQHDDTDYPSA